MNINKIFAIFAIFLFSLVSVAALSVSITSPAYDTTSLTCGPSGNYVYKWFKNGALHSNTAPTLSGAYTSIGDTWKCEVWSVASTTIIYVGGRPVVITNPSALQGASAQVTITNPAPSFTSTPVTTATIGVAYTYDADANDPDGTALKYSLTTSPAGMTINEDSGVVSWTPSAAGGPSVTISVTDGVNTATQTFTITVPAIPIPNQAPTAAFTSNAPRNEGALVSFTDASTDSDGTIASRSWNFGDGSPVSNAVNPTHAYTQNRTYTVTLIVTDNSGASSNTASSVITINDRAPTANFTVSSANVAVGQVVNFTDLSTSVVDPIVSWYWDFGDLTNSTAQNATHSYSTKEGQ